MQDTTDADRTAFAVVVYGIDGGRPANEADELLRDVVAAVRETGKPGSVTVTVQVRPIAKDNTDQLIVTAAATAKPPKRTTKGSVGSVFFVTDDGDLSKTDPTQPTISGLRTIYDKGDNGNA